MEAHHVRPLCQGSVPTIRGRNFVVLNKMYLRPVQIHVCILFLIPWLVSWRVLCAGHIVGVKALGHRLSYPTCTGGRYKEAVGLHRESEVDKHSAGKTAMFQP
jgi:hypothetical protein